MLQTYTFLAGGRQIDAKASFFRYESAAALGADESIRVKADGNDLGIYLPGDDVDLPYQAKRWEILPVVGTITGSVRLGLGRVKSSRLAGTISVVDGGKARTLAGSAFIGPVAANLVAAQNAHCQLWVPAGGVNRLVVKTIAIASGTGGGVLLRGHNAALSSVYGALTAKLLGSGALAVYETRNQNNAGIIGGTALGVYYIAANQTLTVKLDEPIIIPPGQGLVVVHSALATDLTVTFEGFAEANS